MEIKTPGVQLLRKRNDRGDPLSASTEKKLSTTIIISNLWKFFPQQATQCGIMTMLCDTVSPTKKFIMMEPRNRLLMM